MDLSQSAQAVTLSNIAVYDRPILLLAAICSVVASYTLVLLAQRLRHASLPGQHWGWLSLAAFVGGSAMWVSHFLAMLALGTQIRSDISIAWSVLSLLMAILLCIPALALAMRDGLPAKLAGGANFALAAATMHHLGMVGFHPHTMGPQDTLHVVASFLCGWLLATGGIGWLACDTRKARLGAAMLLSGSVLMVHFIAIAGMLAMPAAMAVTDASAHRKAELVVEIACVTLALAAITIALLYGDARARRLRTDIVKAQSLADASIEGLLILGRNGVIAANRQFRAMTGLEADAAGQVTLDTLFARGDLLRMHAAGGRPVEAEICLGDITVPVEVAIHEILVGKDAAQAVAMRDLRRQREAEDRMHHLANFDPLTELPNRRHFYRALRVALDAQTRAQIPLAIFCLDLDRLKQVNDLLGHFAGDSMLRRFADCLRDAVPPGAALARLGGDEFAVAVPGIGGAPAAIAVAEAVHAALASENAKAGNAFDLSASIGIALCPEHGTDKQALLTAADIALYRAKERQRGSWCLFNGTMGRDLVERRQLEHDLRNAAANGELRIDYQAQFDMQGGRICGYEALVRWARPGHGDVPPGVFIPIAERCGAILSIGEWVLQQACADASQWDRTLGLAVNVSRVQIAGGTLVRHVQETLLATGLAPSRLQLEITESALVHDFEKAMLTLRQLKSMGIAIVMDDFGTGYSSLSNLQAFPFDKIKIDPSFVRNAWSDPKSATLVRAVLGIGRGLGVPIVAEGVETPEELAFLRAEKCDEVQGFLLGKPAAVHHIPAPPNVVTAG